MKPNNERRTPANEQNELYTKQVFNDGPLRPAEPEEDDAPSERGFENLSFNRPAVLDERFAARKAKRETQAHTNNINTNTPVHPAAQTKPAQNAAPRPRAKPANPPVNAGTNSHTHKSSPRARSRRLYSGETPSDAALRVTRQIAALVLCLVLVCGGFLAKGKIWDLWTNSDVEDIQKSTYYDYAVQSEKLSLDKNLPYGYDAAQAVCTALNKPIASASIPAKTDDGTIVFPADLAGSMETALKGQKLQLETGLTNEDFVKQIYKSLKSKKPVITLMLVSDAESVGLQYGVVTGLDVENNRVIVAMNDGVDTYTLAEFIAATRFESTKNIPLRLRLSLLFGTLSRNTAIFLK